jgi:hypothetical protein
MYVSGSITTIARELARYKLDLMGVQEVRRDKRGTVKAGSFVFFYGNETKIINYQLLIKSQQKRLKP